MPDAGVVWTIAARRSSKDPASLFQAQLALTISSALLLVLSFPDFDLWFFAWIGLTPLLFVIAQPVRMTRAFLFGWIWGFIFFYGTCWWLTYPMIHFAHFHSWAAYPLFALPVSVVAVFPALFSILIAYAVKRFGSVAVFLAPTFWITCEWLRYVITGQLWNAIGYSQAFHPAAIQSARWGGVYAVSFLVVMTNAALTLMLIRLKRSSIILGAGVLVLVMLIIVLASVTYSAKLQAGATEKLVAVQPNVPMDDADDPAAMDRLLEEHLELSKQGLGSSSSGMGAGRLVIWPESPMNFSYSRDPHLREVITRLTKTEDTELLLNSLEPAPGGGDYNSAVLLNNQGQIVAQYDKIRLMPFGEYVPLPRWLPGASSVRGIVGDFARGSSYTLMPLGDLRAGVFICIEAAHPSIARTFAREGADLLINISNDGYLGPTAVMRQHLANAIFRAVENNRRLVRVTNTGISAFIEADGRVEDPTRSFQTDLRVWNISGKLTDISFYTRYGDWLAYLSALITLGVVSAFFMIRRFQKPAVVH